MGSRRLSYYRVRSIKNCEFRYSLSQPLLSNCTEAKVNRLHRPHSSDIIYSASTFLHRFYMRAALQDYAIQHVAPACLYLATKTEERMRIKVRDLARSMKFELGYEQDVS